LRGEIHNISLIHGGKSATLAPTLKVGGQSVATIDLDVAAIDLDVATINLNVPGWNSQSYAPAVDSFVKTFQSLTNLGPTPTLSDSVISDVDPQRCLAYDMFSEFIGSAVLNCFS
jgi:hypothetical protein